jgi:hypothetical protein
MAEECSTVRMHMLCRWRMEVGLPTLRAEDCRDELMKCHVLRLCEEGGSVLGGPTARDVEGHPVIYKVLAVSLALLSSDGLRHFLSLFHALTG